MSHVEGMGETLRDELLQSISGACEEWLVSALGDREGYSMARALLDACAAHVFQQQWAEKVHLLLWRAVRNRLSVLVSARFAQHCDHRSQRRCKGWAGPSCRGSSTESCCVISRSLSFEILRQLHPDAEIIHRGFAFGHLLALCYPPRSTGQVHHFDLVGGGAYVLTLGLVPDGSGEDQEGTCVLELDESDRQLLLGCGEQAFHTFMLAWGRHIQANASNAFGLLEATDDKTVETTDDSMIETTDDSMIETTDDSMIETTDDSMIETTDDKTIEAIDDKMIEVTILP